MSKPIVYRKNEFPIELSRKQSYIAISVGWKDGPQKFCIEEGRCSGWHYWTTQSGMYNTFAEAYRAAEEVATSLAASRAAFLDVCLLDRDDNRKKLIGSWGLSKAQQEELAQPTPDLPSNTNKLQTFYYTFGTAESFPYQRGWVEIQANSQSQVNDLFRQHFPDKTPGVLNCAFVYTEEEFQIVKESMLQHPDWSICHKHITSDPQTPEKLSALEDQIHAAQERQTPAPTSLKQDREHIH